MKRILVYAAFAFLAIQHAASALDATARPVGPLQAWQESDLVRFGPQWLHVKFVEGSNVTIENGRFTDDTGLDLTSVGAALARAGVLEIRPTINHDRATLRAWKAAGEAQSGAVGPDLSLWFDVRVAGGRAALARLVNDLNASPAVEIAHPEAAPELAKIGDPAAHGSGAILDGVRTPDFTGQQGYLYNPPVGLNAPAAWAVAGGHGDAMKFIDVELCWTEDHEDFNFGNLFYIGGAGQDAAYETHGTAVLGEILGQNNGFGVNGFAPAVNYGVVAVTVAEWPTVPQYFQEAIDHLDRGDVWLIELQMYPPGHDATPMEWLQVNYDVIWTGVWARGIVCMEAGANGSQNLDAAGWGGIFDRTLRDSGAIMVAAGTPTGLTAEWFTNYGSRMDVHAWGSSIVTTGYGDLYNGGTLQTKYTAGFSGTSGASPMATGSALCLQGIAKANLGAPLDPVRLRTIMHDTGTPHQGTKYIGPRPNLSAASLAVLAIAGAPEVSAAAAVEPLRLTISPNPFRSGAEIRFAAPAAERARLVLFNAAGRRIRTLFDSPVAPGEQRLVWDGSDEMGRPLRNGVYFFRLDAGTSQSMSGKVAKTR